MLKKIFESKNILVDLLLFQISRLTTITAMASGDRYALARLMEIVANDDAAAALLTCRAHTVINNNYIIISIAVQTQTGPVAIVAELENSVHRQTLKIKVDGQERVFGPVTGRGVMAVNIPSSYPPPSTVAGRVFGDSELTIDALIYLVKEEVVNVVGTMVPLLPTDSAMKLAKRLDEGELDGTIMQPAITYAQSKLSNSDQEFYISVLAYCANYLMMQRLITAASTESIDAFQARVGEWTTSTYATYRAHLIALR